ncbi:MAG: response regulator transcription factor [Ramlibacter sp.]
MSEADPTFSNEPPDQHLKVLIADDHYLVREGLKLALRQIQSEVEVVEADTLAKAIEAYRAHPDLDLVLLDLTMPGTVGAASALDGFERSCPDARVVVVSAAYDMQTVQWALRKGALGFIPKLSGKEVLLSALRFILDGGIYVPPEAVVGGGADALPRMETDGMPPTPGAVSRQIWLDEPKG